MIQTEATPNLDSLKFLSEKTISAVGTEDIFETEGQGIGGKAPRGARQAPPCGICAWRPSSFLNCLSLLLPKTASGMSVEYSAVVPPQAMPA